MAALLALVSWVDLDSGGYNMTLSTVEERNEAGVDSRSVACREILGSRKKKIRVNLAGTVGAMVAHGRIEQ